MKPTQFPIPELRTKAAISTAEFVICVPILIALFFITPFLNDMIRSQQELSIVARNALQSEAVPSSDYTLDVKRDIKNDESSRAAFVRNEAAGESSSYKALSTAFGSGTNLITPLINGIKDFGVGSERLFPEDPLNQITITFSPNSLQQKYQNFLFNSLTWLTHIAPSNENAHISQLKLFEPQVRRSFVRRDGAFHPDEYKYQALVAFFIAHKTEAKTWWTPDKRGDSAGRLAKNSSFITECTMHFMADDNCERKGNWFAVTTRVLLIVKSVYSLVAAAVTLTASEVAQTAAKEAINIATDEGVKYFKETLVSTLKEKAADQIENAASSVDLFKNIGFENVLSQFTQKFDHPDLHFQETMEGALNP